MPCSISDTRAPIAAPSENPSPSSKTNSGEKKKDNRTIVLCFDGTGNQFSHKNTNVVKLFSILKMDNSEEQVCYYQPGIGTYMKPGAVSPMFRWFGQILDLMFAWYLSEHIIEGYMFLMRNYRPGDKICVFGFSRGAYTARALAGMLAKVGLLYKDNFENLPFAYNLYKHDDSDHKDLAERFKEAFCHTVEIEFLGVWDTVASVGYLWGRTLPFISTNHTIKVFRQALSLDERRARFCPNLYHHTPPPSSGRRRRSGQRRQPTSFFMKGLKRVLRFLKCVLTAFRVNEMKQPDGDETELLLDVDSTTTSGPTIKETNHHELWFKGCHSDVGGGNTEDITEESTNNFALSHVSLRWMVQEIVNSNCGIKFLDDDHLVPLLQRWNIPPKEARPSKPPPPKVLAAYNNSDAEAEIIDELKPKFEGFFLWIFWCFLEVLPTYYEWQEKRPHDGKWVWYWQFSWNLGRGRVLPKGAKYHRSVKYFTDPSKGYKPKAKTLEDWPSFWRLLVPHWSDVGRNGGDAGDYERLAGDDEGLTGQQES